MLAVRYLLRRSFSAGLSAHRDSAYNNADTPFDFTDEHYKLIAKQLKKYPSQYKRSAVKSLLYMAQKQCGGWVPLAAMNKIAKILEISEMEVYEVASFYTMFNREPVGKYHLQVCGTTPCMVRGAREIIKTIEDELGIVTGQTTKCGTFTLTEVECLAACVNAPMLQVGGEQVYEDLTPEIMKKLLDAWKRGEDPPSGPQNGRNFGEGVMKRTTLTNVPQEIQCRDFAQVKQEAEARAEAEAKAKAEAANK